MEITLTVDVTDEEAELLKVVAADVIKADDYEARILADPDSGKTIYDIDELGRQLLGLDDYEAEWLFHEDRTKRQVLAGLRKLRDGGRINELRSFRTYIKVRYGPAYRTWWHGENPGRDGWDYYQRAVAA